MYGVTFDTTQQKNNAKSNNHSDLPDESIKKSKKHHYEPSLYTNDGLRKVDFILTYVRHKIVAEQPKVAHVGHLEKPAVDLEVMTTTPPTGRNGRHAPHRVDVDALMDHESKRREFFQHNLVLEGLELETCDVDDMDKPLTIVKVHVPFSALCRYAEELRIKVPLKINDENWIGSTAEFSHNMESTAKQWKNRILKRMKSDVAPQSFSEPIASSSQSDHVKISWPFRRKNRRNFAINPNDPDGFFKDRDRIEVVWEILQQTPNNEEDPKQRGIAALLEHGIYEVAYPLHDSDATQTWSGARQNSTESENNLKSLDQSNAPAMVELRRQLRFEWATWSAISKLQPLNRINEYFGEKIGFYFAFMDFYTKMLIFPSIFGLVALFYGLIYASGLNELENICINTNPHLSHFSHHSNPGKNISKNFRTTRSTLDAVNLKNFFSAADLWMCPICEPPSCDPWPMYEDGCMQYTWAYRLDNEASIFLSCGVLLWAIIFLKMWKRRESQLAVEWDTHDVEEKESSIRPLYDEKAPMTHRNPVNGEVEPLVPPRKRFLWISISVLVTFCLICFTVICLVMLVVSRIALYGGYKRLGGWFAENNVELARWTIHGLIFTMVTIFEAFYHALAHKLTEFECPKTEKDFLSSLLWKIFIFVLLNDFVPIAYAAWIKGKVRTPLDLNFLSELCDGGCIGEVTELVAVILLGRLIIGNTMEVGIPVLTTLYKERFQSKSQEGGAELPRWRKDYILSGVELDGVYNEYAEMMIQFMFIVFFSPALPPAAFLCFLNNIVEIRVDAIKILLSYRRPLPSRVPGIQIWNRFMDIIIKFGIICNAAMLAFTSDNIPRLYYKYNQSPDGSVSGFTKFSLSSISTESWPLDTMVNFLSNNISECWYPDWRDFVAPYPVTLDYWKIMALRIFVFSVYCIVFFIIMWLINTFVDDVPSTASTMVKRRVYLVTKAMEKETEQALVGSTAKASSRVIYPRKVTIPRIVCDLDISGAITETMLHD